MMRTLTRSAKRAKPFHLGLLRWDGFVYPEMFVGDDAPRGVRLVAAGCVVLLLPVMVPYFAVQQVFYRLRLEEYCGKSAPFRHSIGARAFLATAKERFCHRRPRQFDESTFLTSIEDHSRNLGTGRRLAFVIDRFFADPDAVRATGLKSELGYYEKGWFTTAVSLDLDYDIKEEARRRLEEATGLNLPPAGFHGDCNGLLVGWNGAFNAKLSENLLAINACNIHNHADIGPHGWTAVVYLTPGEVPGMTDEAGTSLWIDEEVGTCTTPDKRFDGRLWRYRPLVEFAPHYNRAVVFPSEALHRGEAGFGYDAGSSRFFMTFFFEDAA
jgi:hypothetical protein